jgi:ankyrin repeat protein
MDIFEAVRVGNIEVVKKYLQYGGDVDNTIKTGSTLLMIAASYGQSEVVKILLGAGADVDAVSYDGMTALMWSMTVMSNPEVVRILVGSHVDIDAAYSRSNMAGATALMQAAGLGLAENVKLLLDAGADVHAMDNYGNTALSRAAEAEHTDIVSILKAAGAVK